VGGQSCIEFVSVYGWAARVTTEIERSGDVWWEAWSGEVLCDSKTSRHEQMFCRRMTRLASLSPTTRHHAAREYVCTLDSAKYLPELYNLFSVLKLYDISNTF
jgi:hypothetical protein